MQWSKFNLETRVWPLKLEDTFWMAPFITFSNGIILSHTLRAGSSKPILIPRELN